MKILIQYMMTINNANFDIADAISDAAEVVFLQWVAPDAISQKQIIQISST